MKPGFNAKAQRCKGAKVETENEFRKTNSEYVEIFNNKYLDFQFRDYYKRLKNYVKDLSTFDRIYDFIKPDIVHFSNTWDMSVRCMIKRAMDLGCETYGTIHGGIVDNAGYLTRKFEIDNYLVWGSDNFEGLVKAGQNPESVKIVGSMQMESWNNKIKNFIKG